MARIHGFEVEELSKFHPMRQNPGGVLTFKRGGWVVLPACMDDILQKWIQRMQVYTRDEVYNPKFRKVFEEHLVAVASKFVRPLPSSTLQLKELLVQVEETVRYVWQGAPESTKVILAPIKELLLVDELFQHTDAQIKMIHASIMNEVSKITLPDAPFSEDIMKKIFQLFMVALKDLASGVTKTTGHLLNNSSRARRILDVMASCKTCLILLDIECDQMVVDMFQLFFDIVRPDHPSDVFENMATVMSVMIDEADHILADLVKILLSSIKLDNKYASPRAWELGKTVVEKCAAKVQPHVREAVKMLNLEVKAYADIVSSLCQYISDGEKPDSEKTVATVHPITVGACSKEALRVEGENAEACPKQQSSLQEEVEGVTTRSKRGRKPNSLLRPEEGYVHICQIGRPASCKFSVDAEMGKDLASPSRSGKADVACSSSGKLDSVHEFPSKRRKRKPVPSNTRERNSGNADISGNEPEGEDEQLLHLSCGGDDAVNKNEQPSRSEPARDDHPRSLNPENGKNSEGLRVEDYGEELVNARIMVWWPLDRTFYTGSVVSYDPEQKKHMVLYDDDDEETLDLKNERWEFFKERH
ncbi:sister chromatid cohesion protein PDS5 homolog D-like [Andrographis paniculata]|uniref:sister chromatid cohesion protein PDS5 homolog D-like n=1 Tax=Andrographis paniculata TaxID=175694 RepID=UPI0021E7C389|nr:sister chromatid cohesion protein PDS5 homolog D-like [Andrographis paniculata]